MNLKQFFKELNGNRVEGELLKTTFYSLLTSFIFLGIIYLIRDKIYLDLFEKYGFYLFMSALSIAIISPAIRQIKFYKELPCMSGMMAGMVTGMVSGFMIGINVGATNGMFTGGFYGSLIGMITGIYLGRCCGIMGIVEGLMAGFMGGLMGAMTALMMFNDNLKVAIFLSFLICAGIMFCLNYLIYRDMIEIRENRKENSFSVFIYTFFVMLFTLLIIIFGYRSVLFQ